MYLFTDAGVWNAISKYLFNYRGESIGYLTNQRHRIVLKDPVLTGNLDQPGAAAYMDELFVYAAVWGGLRNNRVGRATDLMRDHHWGPTALVAWKAIQLLYRLQETLETSSSDSVLATNAMEIYLHSSWQACSYLKSKSVPVLLLEKVRTCTGEEFYSPSLDAVD